MSPWGPAVQSGLSAALEVLGYPLEVGRQVIAQATWLVGLFVVFDSTARDQTGQAVYVRGTGARTR